MADDADSEYTPEERKGYREQFKLGRGCPHCGGLHLRACPRVRRLIFKRPEEIAEVEFWPHGRWPQDDIIWPEDVYVDGDDDEPGTTKAPQESQEAS